MVAKFSLQRPNNLKIIEDIDRLKTGAGTLDISQLDNVIFFSLVTEKGLLLFYAASEYFQIKLSTIHSTLCHSRKAKEVFWVSHIDFSRTATQPAALPFLHSSPHPLLRERLQPQSGTNTLRYRADL